MAKKAKKEKQEEVPVELKCKNNHEDTPCLKLGMCVCD